MQTSGGVISITNYLYCVLQVDKFEIEAVDLSSLTKLTAGHDGHGAGAGWYLDKIIIRPSPDDKQFEHKSFLFECKR